jgi:uncharacterized protein (DUF779 family)
MFYQACCEGTQPQCFEKEVLSKIRDICIGSIETLNFGEDKDLFEYWKHALYFRCNMLG